MSTERTRMGNLEYYDDGGTGPGASLSVRLLRCPACGADFERSRGMERVMHLSMHTPEDFGLSPLGEASP